MGAANSILVRQASRGLSTYGDPVLIPWDEMLGRSQTKQSPQGTWVRIIRGQYKGDLAFVLGSVPATHANGFAGDKQILTLAFVPRISFTKKRKKTPSPRPLPALFDPTKISTLFGEQSVSSLGEDKYKFKGKLFQRGLCIDEISFKNVIEDLHPSPAELLPFARAKIDPGIESLVDDRFKSFWHPGDRVEVYSGSLQGHWGRLGEIDFLSRSAEIDLEHGEQGTFTGRVSVSFRDLRRLLRVGDNVRVVAGEEIGRSGIVVSMYDQLLDLTEDKTREQVRVISTIFYKCKSDLLQSGFGPMLVRRVLYTRPCCCRCVRDPADACLS